MVFGYIITLTYGKNHNIKFITGLYYMYSNMLNLSYQKHHSQQISLYCEYSNRNRYFWIMKFCTTVPLDHWHWVLLETCSLSTPPGDGLPQPCSSHNQPVLEIPNHISLSENWTIYYFTYSTVIFFIIWCKTQQFQIIIVGFYRGTFII